MEPAPSDRGATDTWSKASITICLAPGRVDLDFVTFVQVPTLHPRQMSSWMMSTFSFPAKLFKRSKAVTMRDSGQFWATFLLGFSAIANAS